MSSNQPGRPAAGASSGQNSPPEYVLHLYIAGATPNSTRAVQHLKAICTQYLSGRHELQIIDVYQQPELASQQQVIASPMLVKLRPLPVRRLIGDLSDRSKVLAALGLTPPDPAAHD